MEEWTREVGPSEEWSPASRVRDPLFDEDFDSQLTRMEQWQAGHILRDAETRAQAMEEAREEFPLLQQEHEDRRLGLIMSSTPFRRYGIDQGRRGRYDEYRRSRGFGGGVTYDDNGDPSLERFAQYSGRLQASVRIKHWQLRDLIRCPFAADDVFVVLGNSVRRYDVTKNRCTEHRTFMFEPTCLGFGESFVGVAGEGSEFGVQPVSAHVGDALYMYEDGTASYTGVLQPRGHVNNSIKITKDLHSKLSVFLCNNDGSIKILNGLDSHGDPLVLSEACSISSPVAVNHCAISEQERTLVHVGDDNVAYVHRPSPTGYRLACMFSEARDAGMSCDWNPSGSAFAVASQDGLVCVWDRRHKHAVARLRAGSACRCVKYAPSPFDLLAFSEHRKRVHLVDCRMWSNRQTVSIRDDLEYEQDICGFDFSPCGRNLYIGAEDSVEVFKLNEGSRMSFPFAKFA